MALTLKQARKEIAALGLRIVDTGWDDFRVHWPGAKDKEGYFTTDLDDAVDTAKAMATERAKRATKGG